MKAIQVNSNSSAPAERVSPVLRQAQDQRGWPWLFLFVLLAVLPGCNCGELDGVGNVHDLRIMAIRAEPPEQLVLPVMRPVTVTALIANPPGGYLVGAKWSTCTEQDPATSRCLQTSPGYAALGDPQEVKTGPDGAEPSVTFKPDPVFLERLRMADPYRGLTGLRQIVQVELRAGEETVVGIKRVIFNLPLGPPARGADGGLVPTRLNTNPLVGPLEFNDAGWAPGASVRFTVPPPRMPGQAGMPTPAKNLLAVLEDRSLREEYEVRTYSGEMRTLQETWRYNFFSTNGTFSPTQGGGTNLLDSDAGVEAQWGRAPLEDAGSGPTTVWIVVRDGRGGENWTSRRAEAP